MNDSGEELSDFGETKLKYPKTIEQLLENIDYKEKSKGIFEVDIVMSTEFIFDLCTRLIALEKLQVRTKNERK